ncbi:MAG: MFS transporter [Bacteroidota bacterium]|nr:MFS transporter [Bacteroidota bacterium]
MEQAARKHTSRLVHRIAVAALFFLLGLCFASWASRIPTIRQQLGLTETLLGLVLFALPVGSLLSLSLSGWLIDKWGSKRVVITALLLYSVVLFSIGLASSVFALIIILFFFGMLGNTVNIAVNTQAVGVEKLYGRSIMASFHGLWSLAGFTGAAGGTVMIGKSIDPSYHFLFILGFVFLITVLAARFTLPVDEKQSSNQALFVWPDKSLMYLGIITFCAMMCEGAMFDWSGIYFEKVVGAEKGWIGAGYTGFMCTMATGRFIADSVVNRFGLKATLQGSGLLIATGLLIAVIFPFFFPSLIGFLLVGFGASSIVPLVYSAAGKSKTFSAGRALAAVSTIGFFGFLLGPPLIGLIAGASSLRISFSVIAFMGLCICLLASMRKQQIT